MLENLKTLKDNMVEKHWTICSFLFFYKKINYIVLVKRFVGKDKRISEYALVKLHFMKAFDINDGLEVEANCSGLIADAQKIRNYFGIEYGVNLRDILKDFSANLNRFIPAEVKSEISDIEKVAMVNSLSKSDSENPNKIYCFEARRNPKGKNRSPFNEDKTKLLCPQLFTYFENDTTVSFCYTEDIEKEKTVSEILRNFAKNNSK